MPVYPETTQFSELGQKIKTVFDYLISSHLQESVFPLKIAFIIISVLFLILIFYLLSKSEYLSWKVLFGFKNFLFPKFNKKKQTDKNSQDEEKI